MPDNLVLDRSLHGIRKLETVSAEELDSVIAPGIVGSGDHHARVKAVRAREERHRRGRNYTSGFHAHSGLAQCVGDGCCDPHARLACVAAENHFWLMTTMQCVSKRKTRCVDGSRIQGRFACDASNPVSAKEFPCSSFAHSLTSCAVSFQLLLQPCCRTHHHGAGS